ncbi:MAG: class I SAM-dependent methyltransferase [Flavobacteriales bacterium]|nr:class I SAM-dependent methyltransferase [Flavobacteriales bacterium]
MKQEELKSTIQTACKRSVLLQKALYKILDTVTVRTWHVKRELRKWLKSAPKRAHVLDAGSGVGQFSYWLSCARPEFSILAMDNSKEHVCNGNKFVRETKRTNLHFRSSCVAQLKEEEAFDLILCTQVLEYVDQDQATLDNFHHSLRKNGHVIITTKNKYSNSENPNPETGVARFGYKMKDLKEMVKNAGFKNVKAHYSGGKWGQLAEKIGFLWPIKMLRFTNLSLILLPVYFLIALPTSVLLNWLDSHSAHKNGEGIVLLAKK